MEFNLPHVKDLGQQEIVVDALPYAVVGGAWKGTMDATPQTYTVLNHIVPAGQQLKILFLRVFTQEATGAKFYITQTNPTALNQTGNVEAYPVVGNVPGTPLGSVIATEIAAGHRDYPMLEAPGAEVLHGNLRAPIHVCEGSIDSGIQELPVIKTGANYGIVWWGVEKDLGREG